jgi:hypothetical protein
MSKNLSYLQNILKNIGTHESRTFNPADPTQQDIWTGYIMLEQGFEETPPRPDGTVCWYNWEDDPDGIDSGCGDIVKDGRCSCTDDALDNLRPNAYKVVIDIPCWVTILRITAKSGEEYEFIWDSEKEDGWLHGVGEQAESMIDEFLSCGQFIKKETFDTFDATVYNEYHEDPYGSPSDYI